MSETDTMQVPIMNRIPANGTFELTVRCNLHCKMCMFRHDDKENADIIAGELSTEQWIGMAEQVARAGTFNLLITGGEPMIRPDFCEIWEGIYKQGFIMTLYTNASLVTPKIMETLRKYPPHVIGVTIYGASEETYERVCGNGEAFVKVLDGLTQLKSLPSKIYPRMTVIKDNVNDIERVEELLVERFDIRELLSQPRSLFSAVRGGCCDITSCRLEPEDNVNLLFRRGINKVKEIIGESFDPKNIRIRITDTSSDSIQSHKTINPEYTLLGCDAGMKSYTITWDGKLLGCQTLGIFNTDVLKHGFEKAWELFPAIVKSVPLVEKCQKCTIRNHCETCPAHRYAETGNLGGCPDYACRDAQYIEKLSKGRGLEYGKDKIL